jgi:hypothetical protein
VRIIRRDILKDTMIYLSENGYTEGKNNWKHFEHNNKIWLK